jgi:DNA-binding winged helix-turn-helix (wHTH) protein/TolB-like protein/Flp pilus assembly protein TadD
MQELPARPTSADQSPKRPNCEGANGCYEFGHFILDTARHLLLKGERQVALTPKTYDLLLLLVESGGRLLLKEELMKALWPNSFVEESNLTQQISMARKALRESPGEDRYIVTVASKGYRFAAPVRPRAREASDLSAELSLQSEQKPQSTDIGAVSPSEEWGRISSELPSTARLQSEDSALLRRPRIVLAIAALIAIAVIALAYVMHQRQSPEARSAKLPQSLAILPFHNLRQDPSTDFLGFSLADAVVMKLSYVSALTVRPSSAVEKYRNQAIDIKKVGSDLNVGTLLTGNFVRDGDDLRITSELVDVRSQRIVWKEAFDLKYEKLLTVQDNVAREIVKRLQLSLSPSEAEQLKAEHPIDPLAYEYYLRGVDLYSRNEFQMAIRMFAKAVEISPSYALGWADLGRSYNATASFQFGGRDEYRKAELAYDKALSLQPNQIEARVYMANMFTDTGRVEQAVPLLRDALETNPSHAEAHWELGYAYRFAGALPESVSESEKARQLDPGVKLNSSAINSYLYLGQYDRFLQSLPNDDESAFIVFYRGFAEYYKQNWPAAGTYLNRSYELDQSLLQAQVGKALSLGIGQQVQQGLEMLQAVESRIKERGVGDPEAIYKVGQAFAVLGDRPSALRVLAYSVENGFFAYSYFASDPLLNNIRKEEEFDRLMKVARRRHEAFKKKFLSKSHDRGDSSG